MASIQPGSHLGPYEVLVQVGAGGMGEVWKARDTRLNRSVAIKTSSEQFNERFEREARAVAALNHPHICQLYDVGPNYLVMEYIEGQPLRAPLPLDQALKYGAQICDGLDAAHRKGIVHRDLKPDNILVTKKGVKILDFGLARMGPAVTADDKTDGGLTGKGQILGTLHYMSPEQLHGEKADSRSDIFSFGLVLYEMLTGKRAFDGSSPASVIAAILEREAPSVADVAPATLDRVLRRCLAKDPDSRWQTASDLKSELEWIAEDKASDANSSASTRTVWRERAVWIATLVVLVLSALSIASYWRAPASLDVNRFNLYAPENNIFTGPINSTVATPQFAVSPDGRAIVFTASTAGGKAMLWLRPLDSVAPRLLPGTEEAQYPFWSPDNRWVGFFSDGKLKKTPATGGTVQDIAKGIPDSRGGTWGVDGTILYSNGTASIYRVSSAGGIGTPVTKLDSSRLESSHRWPQFLPDAQHFLFNVRSGQEEQRGLYVGSLDGKTTKRLSPFDTSCIYVSPGYVLFVTDGNILQAQAFDADRLELQGEPFDIADGVGRSAAGNGGMSASMDGAVLAHAGAMLRHGNLSWFDRSGNWIESIGAEGDYVDFRLSPDEQQLALSLVDPRTSNSDIWLIDLARNNTPMTFTSGPRLNAAPVWSPDGQQIVFRSNRAGWIEFYRKSAAGGGSEEVLLTWDAQRAAGIRSINLVPTDWSPDGRNILFTVPDDTGSGFDLWTLPTFENAKPEKFIHSSSHEIHGNFSPNGRFVAYGTDADRKSEVYVRTVPLSDQIWKVSTDGGSEPRWRGDGREIYYLSKDRKLMAVSVAAGPSPFGIPKILFQTHAPKETTALRTNYVPARNGQRFLINTQIGESSPAPITVVLNRIAGLKK